jgi:hypothetical protein
MYRILCRILAAVRATLRFGCPDIGDDEIWVNSHRVTRSTLEAMRKTLGSSLR